jgi:hypothetical protein
MKFLTSETKEELRMVAEKNPAMRNAVQQLIDFSDDEEAVRYRRERIRPLL